MDESVREALNKGGLVDITTIGQRTGDARRIEIGFHNIDGHLYISGIPRPKKRGWLLNLEAQPHFTFHLKGPVSADLPATARVITDPSEREKYSRRSHAAGNEILSWRISCGPRHLSKSSSPNSGGGSVQSARFVNRLS